MDLPLAPGASPGVTVPGNSTSLRGLSNTIDKERAERLILMLNPDSDKRWKQRKCDYLKKLERDNKELKEVITEYSQQIGSLRAQNDILHEQLEYFKTCLAQMAPIIMNQTDQ